MKDWEKASVGTSRNTDKEENKTDNCKAFCVTRKLINEIDIFSSESSSKILSKFVKGSNILLLSDLINDFKMLQYGHPIIARLSNG